MDLKPLISTLSDGEFHSGSELGQMLGVSRTAIWKSLDRLSDYGLAYESQRGLGYRLLHPIDLVDERILCENLEKRLAGRVSVTSLLSCESTNLEVSKLYPEFGAQYCAVLSEMQTAGRGRRGRSWVSPFAKNIYLSLGFEWAAGVNSLQGLSIVIGVAVAGFLRGLGVAEAGIKWPNDIWVDQRKLAGILIELQGEVSSSWRVTVGLGLNVSMVQSDGASIDQPWCSLNSYINVGRTELAVGLIESVCRAIDEFSEKGFSAFIQQFDQYDVLRGQTVRLEGPDIEGEVIGLDDTGAILLRHSAGIDAYSAGEISVRPV